MFRAVGDKNSLKQKNRTEQNEREQRAEWAGPEQKRTGQVPRTNRPDSNIKQRVEREREGGVEQQIVSGADLVQACKCDRTESVPCMQQLQPDVCSACLESSRCLCRLSFPTQTSYMSVCVTACLRACVMTTRP